MSKKLQDKVAVVTGGVNGIGEATALLSADIQDEKVMETEESMSSSQKLQGKVAIITGGASGIGEATARLFADHGARMVVIADIQDELGEKVAASIGTGKCSYVHCDVTKEDEVKKLVEWTIQNYFQLDIIFSNAGIAAATDQTILDLDLQAFDQVFTVNVRGMAACVKHAALAMVKGRMKGSIICTASIAASCGSVRNTDYYSSKHAVIGLVRCGSKQLGEYGIRVNCVSPYAVATPTLCRKYQMDAEQAEKFFEANTSLKGGVLRVKHVADAVLFLASDDSQFITGHDLVVDGGFLCK